MRSFQQVLERSGGRCLSRAVQVVGSKRCFTTGTVVALNQGNRAMSQVLLHSRSLRSPLKAWAGLLTATRELATSSQLTSSSSVGLRSLTSADFDQGSASSTACAFAPTADSPTLAWELIQGPLARWTRTAPGQAPPTIVLVHGILGRRQNLNAFARMLAQGFPAYQVLLVDLRCHGESAWLTNRPDPPHTVASAAKDVLGLLNEMRLFPHVLIGHSFGGKVVMSMVQQFGSRRLPRPLQVWALDSLPGEVRSGEAERRDHPEDLIKTLRAMPLPIRSRNDVTDYLESKGFSQPIARWTATNLVPVQQGNAAAGFTWQFDLEGIHHMYKSYEETNLYPLLEQPPQGLRLDFVKAERSSFRWGGGDEERIVSLGHRVHLLGKSGHWVHTDNPVGLFDILAPSFGVGVDLRQQRAHH